jgi:hypothetical protein
LSASPRLAEACASSETTRASGFSSRTVSKLSDARTATRTVPRRPRPATRDGEAALLAPNANARAPAPARGRTAVTRTADVAPMAVPMSTVAMTGLDVRDRRSTA